MRLAPGQAVLPGHPLWPHVLDRALVQWERVLHRAQFEFVTGRLNRTCWCCGDLRWLEGPIEAAGSWSNVLATRQRWAARGVRCLCGLLLWAAAQIELAHRTEDQA